jgi:lysophospholipase L1-like esterase
MAEPSTGRRALYALIAAGVGLLLVELLAQAALFAVSPEDQVGDGQEATGGGDGGILLHGDPHLLWRLAPGDREEHGQRVHINAAGFRDRERGPAEGPRLLALGDSSVYGFGVSDAAVFTARLEGMLDGVGVINGGVPGYSTEQALNRLSREGLAMEPDVLLVATLWSDNNFDQFVDAERLGAYRAWRSQPGARVAALLRATATGHLLSMALGEGAGGGAHTVGWMQTGETGGGRRRVPIGDYAENLARFCTVMAERDGGVVFVLLPNVEDLSAPRGAPPWTPYRDAMTRTAAACGAPLVSVPDAFAASGMAPGQLFLDEMHPSARGHGVMAQAIADTLAAQGWPGTPLRVRDPGGPVGVGADPFEGRGEELGLVEGRSGRSSTDGPPGPPPEGSQGGPPPEGSPGGPPPAGARPPR